MSSAPPAAPAADHVASYVESLRHHDWTYEYSDDIRVWRAGNESLKALRSAQPLVDPDFSIWNTHAPEDYRETKP